MNSILPKYVPNETVKDGRRMRLEAYLRACQDDSVKRETTLNAAWQEYKQRDTRGYGYSQFVSIYHEWREENQIEIPTRNKWTIDSIDEADARVLSQWRRSNDRCKWERAVAITGLHMGTPITEISKKLERSCHTIQRWRAGFLENGVEGLGTSKSKKVPDHVSQHVLLKKERLIELIHESPQIHNINRASWSLKTLAQAYEATHRESISISSISEYVREEGYTFKKAKKVLTSPDPEFRAKLARITEILSNLQPDEKFFSIDEFGPVAIRIRGGTALCHKDQVRTIPQRQRSKGRLICTAALELSTNQVTHFYSDKKNTCEMIKLLEILLEKYRGEKTIYFSWDAASWHASKKLCKKVEEVNDPDFRRRHNTPKVELAPLPASAQFLNVIESVFSGMAKAVIHNSNYSGVDECKRAIDRYFLERNWAFTENPKRAGKKIWGKEIVKPVFSPSNNCKDRKWR